MAKKSNKTSHVLNLLTNRTGLSVDDLEQTVLPKEKSVRKQPEISAEKPAAEKPTITEAHAEAPVKAVQDVSERIRINLEKIERGTDGRHRE